MGTPDFAIPSLSILIKNNYQIAAVVTAPDRPQGRGQKLTPSPVKTFAVDHQIQVLQPKNLKSTEFLEELRGFNANLQVVVAFRMLPEAVWAMPEFGTFNLHASKLPQYRGAAPINWAIINGEKETGITTFFLQHEIDTGNMILQDSEPVSDTDDAGSLHDRLMEKGAGLVLKTVQAIEANNYQLQPQAATESLKPAPKIHKETCEINWAKPLPEVYNFIRGLAPYPGAWTKVNDQLLKIFKCRKITEEEEVAEAGGWKTDNKSFLKFRTRNGWLEVLELQLQGKRKMTIDEFLRGNKL
jgi:methionyl-tRNA formyltransferase